MARKFLNTVRTEIATLLADNNIGGISPLDLRTCLSDTLDSTYNAGGSIVSGAAAPPAALTATFVQVPFTTPTTRNGEPTFVEMAATGVCDIKAPATGFALDVIYEATVQVPNNEDVQFAVFQNGVKSRWTAEAIGSGGGAGDPHSVSLAGILVGAVGTIDLRYACPTGATVTLATVSLVVAVRPTQASL